VAAEAYDPLSIDHFRIVRAVSSYQYLDARWYDAPESRRETERLLEETRRWCEAIKYAIANRSEIPALREIQQNS